MAADAVLAALFDNARVGLAFWDRDLRFRRVNGVLAGMNGIRAEDHIGRRPGELLPELGSRLEETFRGIIASGDALRDVDIVGETPAAPGVERHWLASYFPVRDDSGAPAGIAGLIVEVTGEREAAVRADEALERSAFVDAELRALYAALPVGVAFLNTELRYQRVNDTLARMNGRTAADHVGASLVDIVGEPAAQLEQALRRVMDTREPLEIELTGPAPGAPDETRAFEATYFPVLDATGVLLGLGGVVRDVTDRHALELEQSRLLQQALVARAEAEAAGVRSDDAREEAEQARADAERAGARMSFLARAGRELASSMDWDTTLKAVVRSAVPDVADWCALTLVEPRGRLRVVAVAHVDPEREKLAWKLVSEYPPQADAPTGTANVIRTGQLEVTTDMDANVLRAGARDEEHLRLLLSLNARHVATAPLAAPTGIIGALTFVLGDSDRRFMPGDRDLLTSLASRAALHVQNARLYNERSHIAETLQASLRPRELPAIPGAEVAARYLPAGDANQVGGDFYDLFLTGEAVWTAIVGDVSGKGPEAAAVTALARHSVRLASMVHDDPAANLELLNRAVHADTPHFCTLVYARLCPGEAGIDVRFANGGHPAPLVLRANGAIEEIEDGRGPLVGALRDVRFEEATLSLSPGDVLLMYTDGVTEVRTEDVDLGTRELRATLAAHVGASAEKIVAAVEDRAVELQLGAPRDDIALVAIKALPKEATVDP